MSLGGYHPSSFEENAFQAFCYSGMLLIASAGNDGDSIYNYPASYSSVISVAAVDSFKSVAFFSNFNDQVELSGPGVAVLSTVPGGSCEYFDGTSMACPHVSGVAELVWSLFPSFSNVELRNVLSATAEDLGPMEGYDVDYGYDLARADLAVDFLESGNEPLVPPPTPVPDPIDDECVDDPGSWVDLGGDDCSWYDTTGACSAFGGWYENDGLTANDVCCNCGGGTTGCVDDDWIDSFGDGCSWCESPGNCELYDDSFENDGKTANDTRCVCRRATSTSILA